MIKAFVKQHRVLTLLFVCISFLVGCGAGSTDGEDVLEPLGSGASGGQICEVDETSTYIVDILGAVTFERLLTLAEPSVAGFTSVSLDVENPQTLPAKGIAIELVDCAGTVLDSTETNDEGEYRVRGATSSQVKVRVVASMTGEYSRNIPGDSQSLSWSVAIRDNRSRNAIYAFETDPEFVSVLTRRNIHLSSGVAFTTALNISNRQAAPFAILDSIGKGIDFLIDSGYSADLPHLNIFWNQSNRSSVNNSPSEGELVSSYFSGGNIYLLGHLETDADDYDEHVIIHEWAHYLEYAISRSDSIGGSHFISGAYDPRLSFSEGFSNAFSAIVLDDAVYRDTLMGDDGFTGLGFDIEANSLGLAGFTPGWFNEFSVQSILYDLIDGHVETDGSDEELDLPDEEIEIDVFDFLSAFGNQHKTTGAFTTIFSFIDAVKQNLGGNSEISESIDVLTEEQSITAIEDEWGDDNRTWDSLALIGERGIFPVLSGAETVLCLDNTTQPYNGLATRRFMRFNHSTTRTILFEVQANSSTVDPVLRIYHEGVLQHQLTSSTSSLRQSLTGLDKGEYVIELTEQKVLTGDRPTQNLCFDVSANFF